jgi:hypothetical protein
VATRLASQKPIQKKSARAAHQAEPSAAAKPRERLE